MLADEAGFESLVGTEETLVPSRIYTEKALCMAKGFLSHALAHPVPSLSPIIDWVYIKPGGPGFLRLMIEESRALVSGEAGCRKTKVMDKLSAGARILLQPHLRALEAKAVEFNIT